MLTLLRVMSPTPGSMSSVFSDDKSEKTGEGQPWGMSSFPSHMSLRKISYGIFLGRTLSEAIENVSITYAIKVFT